MDYKEILKKYDQEHVLKYMDMMDEEQKANCIKQIESIDFEQLKNLYALSKKSNEEIVESLIIEHMDFTDKYRLSKEEYNEIKVLGEDVIKAGKYAVITTAGGQGTRLGHTGPKGTFLVDIKPEPEYLFQIILDTIKRANEKYGVTITWYIMTSTENDQVTRDFFEEHNYFDYPKEKIVFFVQDNMPLLSEDGKVLINKQFEIKEASDGNGCIYKALKKNGLLDKMKQEGTEWIFVGSVDNVLVHMVDPLLVGLTIKENNLIGSKSIIKSGPHERVGVFCKKNSKPGIIEYSEMPEEMAEETDEEGELVFADSNIVCHLYNIKAMEQLADVKLPYHSAHKKADFMQLDGEMFKATEPNAYKYEAFIFDGFSYFDDMSVLRVKREEEFAPIKNKEGNDSPETAIALYNKFWNLD